MFVFRAWLLSGQTTTVTVTASVPQNTEVGVKDKITLTAQGLSRVSQSATLTVSTQSTYQVNKLIFLFKFEFMIILSIYF